MEKDSREDAHELIGETLVAAEETSTHKTSDYGDIHVSTWYKFRTPKKDVTLRFQGSSNGYYSVKVHVELSTPTHSEF